jgi:hypothetical protein
MKIAFRILPAIVLVAGLATFPRPSFACDPGVTGKCGEAPGQQIKGAPAPLLGAGLPGLAIGIGYGAYLLVRRRRNAG